MIFIDRQSGLAAQAEGPGERLQRQQQRRVFAVKGALFAFGGIAGAFIGFNIASNGFDFGGQWPPAVAATLAILYVVALFAGSHFIEKSIDEVERMRTYRAVSFAGVIYLTVYPVWFLLWKGGFTGEPSHWMLFIAFWGSLLAASLYYRLR